MLLTALLLGAASSLHCVGMCGAIALALPRSFKGRVTFIAGRLLYNAGRIFTYSILGFGVSVVGSMLNIHAYQEALSIGIGILLLVAVFAPSRIVTRLSAVLGLERGIQRGVSRLKSSIGGLFGSHRLESLFAIGLLNGLLPCGLVYMALAGALSMSTPLEGASFMLVFGAGTLPAMLVLSFAGTVIPVRVRARLGRLVPVAIGLMGVLFVVRGLGLGIPYLSPHLIPETVGAWCHW
jgi:uncharacterized protein